LTLLADIHSDIGKLVAKEIGAVILLSAVLALPLAALAIARYLATYTERTAVCLLGLGSCALGVFDHAAIAGARQAWIAMTLKPTVALRT
jgi:putative ABC transport system permease protein